MSKGWRITVGLVLGLSVMFVALLAWIYLTGPRLTEEQFEEFTICNEHFVLAPEFTAFDYGTRKSADRFPGDRYFHIRSGVPGNEPPATFEEIFDQLPLSLGDVFDGPSYAGWLQRHSSVESSVDSNWLRGQTVNLVGGCSVVLSMRSQTELVYPRSEDWALTVSCPDAC